MEHNSSSLPEYLYHYTTLDVLEKILSNRTIRFNSLINMDDMEEAKTSDFSCIGKYLYVSPWSNDGDIENIALWGLYSNHYEGVRIKMKVDPFIHYKTPPLIYFSNNSIDFCIPYNIIENNLLYIYPSIPFIRTVEYTNDINKIYPSTNSNIIIDINSGARLTANFTELGRYKRKEWYSQNEIRYQFCIFPHNLDGGLNLDISNSSKGLPFNFWDVNLSDDGYNSIEITIGPKMNFENQNKANILMKKYFPDDFENRIRYSSVKIR